MEFEKAEKQNEISLFSCGDVTKNGDVCIRIVKEGRCVGVAVTSVESDIGGSCGRDLCEFAVTCSGLLPRPHGEFHSKTDSSLLRVEAY